MATTTKKYVSLEKLGLYDEKIKKVITDGDAAALQGAKDYADGLADNYDAAGAAATAEANAKAYADGKDEAIAAAKKAGDDAQVTANQAVADAAAAQGAADAAQGDVDDLAELVGTLPDGTTATSVVDYVNVKTAGIATDAALGELQGQVTAAQGAIDAIEADYLKAADKEELQGNIDALAGTQATDKAALEASIKGITDDYLKAADKTELQNNIDTVSGAVERLTNGVSADEVDGVNDLIQYVKDHGTEVTGMQGDIADNAAAIEGVAGRVTTLEGEMDAVEGAVATKAEKTYVDEQVGTLQGADTALGNRITTLENKFGGAEGSVEDMIADAKAEAIETAGTNADTKDEAVLAAAKKYADEEDAKIESRVDALETASGTHALASDVTALAGRVTTVEGKVTTLEGKMTAVETKAANNETAIGNLQTAVNGKASQTDLDNAVARITANEEAIAAFVEVSEEEINALFQ